MLTCALTATVTQNEFTHVSEATSVSPLEIDTKHTNAEKVEARSGCRVNLYGISILSVGMSMKWCTWQIGIAIAA